MQKKNRSIKIIVRIISAIFILFAVMAVLLYCLYRFAYGRYSLPEWIRPSHEAMNNVVDYHSDIDFDEPANSELPRIDISMASDYKLSKDNYTKCSIQISNAEEYDLDESAAKIKIRGNTTQFADKKPYKIKFEEKTSLFGGGKEKSWVLLANVSDITGLHNYISMEIYRFIASEGTFVPMVQFVNLYINGDYQGVYNLCDQVETGKTRVPISGKIKATPEETDYLLENDMYAYYEGNAGEEGIGWFWLDKSITPFEVKSPDTEDSGYSKEYTDYIQNRLSEIYDVILTKDWDAIQNVIDVDSVINGFLVSMITNNVDISYKSVYYYLPAGGKLTYGPVWDMDMTFGEEKKTDYHLNIFEAAEMNAVFEQLMQVPEFRAAFSDRYRQIYPQLETFIMDKIDEAVSYAGSDLENEFIIRADWGRYGTAEYTAAQTYDESIAFMKKWTHERVDFLYSKYCN